MRRAVPKARFKHVVERESEEQDAQAPGSPDDSGSLTVGTAAERILAFEHCVNTYHSLCVLRMGAQGNS